MEAKPVIALGTLEKVDLRQVWKSEAQDFTPWLAQPDNIRILGDAIGIELNVEAVEKQVGPFRADILCRSSISSDTEWVLIENQLARTDHTHLGQLMTYAAGLEAATIVWIAEKICDEHRAALDWLNTITNESFRFFGLEIQLWKIGASPAAPKFNVVCQPNDWATTVKTVAAGELSESKQLQRDFWEQFLDLLRLRSYTYTNLPKAKPQHALEFSLGRTGFWVATVASTWNWDSESPSGELRVELCTNVTNSDACLDFFKNRANLIVDGIGESVDFYVKPDVKMRRIIVRKNVELSDRSHWNESALWLCERLEKFQKVFRPLIAQLPVELLQASDSTESHLNDSE